MGWLELTELGERFADTLEQLVEFELRDAGGAVIPTQHVAVQDTDRMTAMADELLDDTSDVPEDESTFDDEFSAALIELGMVEPPTWDEPTDDRAESLEEPNLPRFQVYVELERADSVPIADRWRNDPDVQEMLDAMRREGNDAPA
jgi:hypothetical protein